MYYATSPEVEPMPSSTWAAEVTRFKGIMTARISVWGSGIDVSVFMSAKSILESGVESIHRFIESPKLKACRQGWAECKT